MKKKVVIFSSGCLRGLYGAFSDLRVFEPNKYLFSQYLQSSHFLFEEAFSFLKTRQWDVAAIQFLALDYVGHLETPRSMHYIKVCRLIDNYVQQLVSITTEQDVILITSEHGMDNDGFHVDRNPSVIDTPFILTGPDVEKGGPWLVSQNDWAPTLSIFLGISPFYNVYSFPNLDFIRISDEDSARVLQEFSRILREDSQSINLEKLRGKRQILMAQNNSRSSTLCLLSAVVLSLVLQFYLLYHANLWQKLNFNIISLTIFIGCLCFFLIVFFYTGILDHLSHDLPFSANFIISHGFSVPLFLIMLTLVSMFFAHFSKNHKDKINEIYLLIFFIFTFACIYLSDNPYNLLGWILVCSFLIGWGISKRISWLLTFLSFAAGLLIRRLTFYNAYNPIHLPPRWLISSSIFIVGMTLLWYRLRKNPSRNHLILLSFLSLLPSLLSVILPDSADIRITLMLMSFPFIIWFNKNIKENTDIFCSLWVTLLLLGSSSSIELTTHIVIFPMILATFASSKETSVTTRGILITLFFWSFYLLPGNSFDLKLLELKDSFIMSAASTAHIGSTVFVVSVRYIAPIFALTWMLTKSQPLIPLWLPSSVFLLPVMLAAGISFFSPVLMHSPIFPWQEYTRIFILICTTFIILGAYMMLIFYNILKMLFHLRDVQKADFMHP